MTTEKQPALDLEKAAEVMNPILARVGMKAEATRPELSVVPINAQVDEPADDFEWSFKNGAVIVPEQRELAVYTNNMGQAVIRVRADYPDESDDPFICISHGELPRVIAALQAIAARPLTRDRE